MSKAKTILIANGVNLDLLGNRELDQYGSFNLQSLEKFLLAEAPKIAQVVGLSAVQFKFFQSNSETEFMEKITSMPYDGAVINPAAWTHTSLALADRLATLTRPFVEVHISHLAKREPMRQTSLTARYSCGVVYGLGMHSYAAGALGVLYKLVGENP